MRDVLIGAEGTKLRKGLGEQWAQVIYEDGVPLDFTALCLASALLHVRNFWVVL